MVKIGDIDLKGELVEVSVDELIEDVPVNEEHVRYLMNSLKEEGQISPILVWQEGKRVFDGFHRLSAVKRLGWKVILCLIYSCDEKKFWDLRITSAVSHKTVHFARVIEWVQLAFQETDWGKKMNPSQAFGIGQRGAGARVSLSPEERKALTAWVYEKSRQWRIEPNRIREMLQIAEISVPTLIKDVREDGKPGVVTPSIMAAIARSFPRRDIQTAIVQKVKNEKLILKDINTLLERLAEAETEQDRERILRTVYRRKPRTGGSPKTATEELQKIRSKVVTDALHQLCLTLPQLSKPQPFDEVLREALAVIGIYFEGESLDALEILQRENNSLKEEGQRQAEKIERMKKQTDDMRRTISSQQAQINELVRRD